MRYLPAGGLLEELYAVTGLDPSVPDNYVGAVNVFGIPAYQQPHPTVVGFSVMGYETWQMGDERSPNRQGAWVKVIYGTAQYIPQGVDIEIETMSGTRVLDRWVTGSLAGAPVLIGIELSAADGSLTGDGFPAQINPSDATPSSDFISNVFYQTAQYPVLTSGLLLKFSLREVNPPPVNFRGRVNSVRWNGLDPGLWLCYYVGGKKTPPGSVGLQGWTNSYHFVTSDNLDFPAPFNGFVDVALFRDRITGKPFPGIDPTVGDNNGYTVIPKYKTANFFSLPLPGNVYT